MCGRQSSASRWALLGLLCAVGALGSLTTACTTIKTPDLQIRSIAQNVLVNSSTASGEWTVVQVSPSALDDEFSVTMTDGAGLDILTEKRAAEGQKTGLWSSIFAGLFGFLGGLLVGG